MQKNGQLRYYNGKNMIKIRKANKNDAKRIREIYSYYVLNTAITFDYDIPDVNYFMESIEKINNEFTYLVLEKDNKIIGYSYAVMYKPRLAYKHSVEVTIYLDINEKGNGYGKMLYNELEKELKQKGVTNLYAAIGYPIINDKYLDKNSVNFHSHLGYIEVGHLNKCGYKFDTFYDLVWMEKII